MSTLNFPLGSCSIDIKALMIDRCGEGGKPAQFGSQLARALVDRMGESQINLGKASGKNLVLRPTLVVLGKTLREEGSK